MQLRHEFPLLSQNASLIYLDSAATSQKPKKVIDRMTYFLQKEYGTVHRAVYALAATATAHYDDIRMQIRAFLGVGEDGEVIFTRGTTEGINLVASSFGKAFLQEGDEILICETEHHSNIVPWQMICQEKKAQLKIIPVDDRGEICLDVYRKMLSSKTKLVAVAHIANATGVVHPIHEIIELAHQFGAKVLVDAAQSVPHKKISVRDLDVDFLVFSAHKVYGPTGVGVLYGKKVWLDQMPPYQGGGDMVEQVTFEKTTYQPLPLKFEAGTPSIVEVMGLGSALEFLQEIGLDQIEAWEKSLTEYALMQMESVEGLSLLCHPKHRSSIVTFHAKGCHSLDVGTLLDMRGIAVRTGHFCAQPTLRRFGVRSAVRMSLGVYNTKEDIDRFVEALREVLHILRK